MPKIDRQSDKEARVRSTSTRRTESSAKAYPIDWNEWNPFKRATGSALKQLNKRQPAVCLDDFEEALL